MARPGRRTVTVHSTLTWLRAGHVENSKFLQDQSLHRRARKLTSRLTGLFIIVVVVIVLRPFEQRGVPHPGSTSGTSLQHNISTLLYGFF